MTKFLADAPRDENMGFQQGESGATKATGKQRKKPGQLPAETGNPRQRQPDDPPKVVPRGVLGFQ
jgi:hypothetical protein